MVNFYLCMLRNEFAAKLESMIGYLIMHGITYRYSGRKEGRKMSRSSSEVTGCINIIESFQLLFGG